MTKWILRSKFQTSTTWQNPFRIIVRTVALVLMSIFCFSAPLTSQELIDPEWTRYRLPIWNHIQKPKYQLGIAAFTPFAEVAMRWWDGASSGYASFGQRPEVASAIVSVYEDAPNVVAALSALDIWEERSPLPLIAYAVEAERQWDCVTGVGCYPKGVILGSEIMPMNLVLEVCEAFEKSGLYCVAISEE